MDNIWCYKLAQHTHTYQVEARHATSGLTILHVEEKEDVNGPENEVEDSPSRGGADDVGLLGHHPESGPQPVHT